MPDEIERNVTAWTAAGRPARSGARDVRVVAPIAATLSRSATSG